MHVGRSAAYIHDNEIAYFGIKKLRSLHYGARSGDYIALHHVADMLHIGSLDNMLFKRRVYYLPRRLDVNHIELRVDVFCHVEGYAGLFKYVCNLAPALDVASVDNGRLETRFGDCTRIEYGSRLLAVIRAPCEHYEIRVFMHKVLDVIAGQLSRRRVSDYRTCAERRRLSCADSHVVHESVNAHAKSACRTRRRKHLRITDFFSEFL